MNYFQCKNRDQITEMAERNYPVIVPLAATEQHGPHLPVYTDSIICEYIVAESIKKVSPFFKVLQTPMISIGCSEHHLKYGGTLSFSPETYLHVLKDIGQSLIASGFRKIIFINAHGGNANLMSQVAHDLSVHYAVWTASASYWDIAKESLKSKNIDNPNIVPGHA